MDHNNSKQNKQNSQNNSNMEIANEYNLDQEAIDTLVSTKAGGQITKRLVELGEKQLMQNSNFNSKQGK